MVWEDPQCSALGHGSRKRCPPVVNPVTQTQATLPGEPLRTQDGQGALHLPHRESEGGGDQEVPRRSQAHPLGLLL